MQLSLRQRKTKEARPVALEADKAYNATVVSIDGLDDEVSLTFSVKYRVELGEHSVLYSEVFSVYQDNPRTAKLLDHLSPYGITADDLSGYLGCVERITFGYEFRHGRQFFNIVERTMVEAADSEAGDET